MSEDAAARLANIQADMAGAAQRAGRDAGDVTLIAVSKMHDAAAIAPLIAAGQRVFGENRVQEAAGKWPSLRAVTPGIELHLIGQLQSNKAAEAVALFDAIHSLDRSSLVSALARTPSLRAASAQVISVAKSPDSSGGRILTRPSSTCTAVLVLAASRAVACAARAVWPACCAACACCA